MTIIVIVILVTVAIITITSPPSILYAIASCQQPAPCACRNHTGEGPWLTIGVLIHKDYATTSNGQAFSKWQLADLKGGDLRVVLFGDAHGAHKTMVRVPA